MDKTEGVEARMRPHRALCVRNAAELGLYSEGSEKPLKGFNYGADMVRSVILKSHSGLV